MANVQQVGRSVTELLYVTPDGRKLKASLEPSDVNFPGFPGVQSTYDPMWITTASPHRQVWLGYKGGDGNLWWTKVHAQWQGGGCGNIEIRFEHRGPGGPGQKPEDLPEAKSRDVKYKIGFFSWDGSFYTAEAKCVDAKVKPDFVVTKY